MQFRVYSLHLKASSGNSNAQQRLQEATILRNYLNELPSGSHFIIGGDFNIIPEAIDVYDYKKYEFDALFKLEIRKKFRELINTLMNTNTR